MRVSHEIVISEIEARNGVTVDEECTVIVQTECGNQLAPFPLSPVSLLDDPLIYRKRARRLQATVKRAGSGVAKLGPRAVREGKLLGARLKERLARAKGTPGAGAAVGAAKVKVAKLKSGTGSRGGSYAAAAKAAKAGAAPKSIVAKARLDKRAPPGSARRLKAGGKSGSGKVGARSKKEHLSDSKVKLGAGAKTAKTGARELKGGFKGFGKFRGGFRAGFIGPAAFGPFIGGFGKRFKRYPGKWGKYALGYGVDPLLDPLLDLEAREAFAFDTGIIGPKFRPKYFAKFWKAKPYALPFLPGGIAPGALGLGIGLGPQAVVGTTSIRFNSFVSSQLGGDLNAFGRVPFLPNSILADNRGYTYSMTNEGRVVAVNVPNIGGLEDIELAEDGLLDQSLLPDNAALETQLVDPNNLVNSLTLPNNYVYSTETKQFYARSDAGVLESVEQASVLNGLNGLYGLPYQAAAVAEETTTAQEEEEVLR